jgi:hypothetical protein
LKNLVQKTKIEVIKKNKGNNLISEKILSILSWNKNPIMATGTEAIIIKIKLSKKYLINLRKKNKTENKVAR